MTPPVRLDGTVASIRLLTPDDAAALTELLRANREFLTPFDPARPEDYWTLKWQRAQLEENARDAHAGLAYVFGIYELDDDQLAGRIAINNVVRKAWLSATLGYWVDETHNARGLATDAAKLAVDYAFDVAGLHRVQAAVMPKNSRSIRVLENAGFRYEGLSERYLLINGVWEDHLMYAITAEDRKGREK
jgi:ribosomal-protein-alanine N-acetyltransferase